MTREEAIDRLKEAKVGHKEFLSVETLNMAIQALEQEPCGDAISRQAVLEELPRQKMRNNFGEVIGEVVYIDDIRALPPVTPQPKMGRWIKGTYKDTCDKCRCTYPKDIGIKNYCPNCGAIMKNEADERGEKE